MPGASTLVFVYWIHPPSLDFCQPSWQYEQHDTTSEQAGFLSWKIVPARLNATQAAWFLGFELHEIRILIAANLLKPLGHPARNGAKFFATQALEQLRRDERWLARACDVICDHWRKRNRRNRSCGRGTNGRNPFS